MQEESSDLTDQPLSIRDELTICTDGAALLENVLLKLVEGAESTDEARDVLSKYSPQAGVCGGKIHSSWGCLDCQADPTCVVCGDCFDESKHKGHRYHFKPYSSGCCDCGDPDAWNPEGFCDKHSGPSIDQLDLPALFSEIPLTLQAAQATAKALAWNIKMKSQALLLEDQIELIEALRKNLAAILSFTLDFVELNAAFKKLLSDAIADPLCGYSAQDCNTQILLGIEMENHLCKEFVAELLNPESILRAKEILGESEDQKENPVQSEGDAQVKKQKVCLCTPLDCLLSAIQSFNTGLGKQITKLFYLMMGSYKFKCHYAYAYISNFQTFTSLSTPAAISLQTLEVQYLTVPEIAATLVTNTYLYFKLSMTVNKFLAKIADCVQEQDDSVPSFHVFYTLIYIFQSLPNNEVLLKKETPFLQMLTLSLLKLDQLDPKLNVTSHVDYDVSCVTGLQITHVATLWTRVLSIYELLDPMNHELMGSVMRALVGNLKRKPSKKHDFEEDGFFWFTFSHRLLFLLLRNWLIYRYLLESKSSSSFQESKENQLPDKQISPQQEEIYLRQRAEDLVSLLELDDQNQLDTILEDAAFGATKCLSFIHQIKSKKWILLGLQVQSITKLYHQFFQFSHFDIGTIQTALLLHSRPSQLIHKVSHSYYALQQASWSKSFLFLVKMNLYDEQLMHEVKKPRNMDNLNEFMLLLLTLFFNPEPLYVHLFEEPTLPPLRKKSYNDLKEKGKFIEQDLTMHKVLKTLFLAQSSLSLPKLMKKIKNAAEGPLLKQTIAQLTSRYTATSGEVKFRLAQEQAARVDAFRFMDTSDILQAESKGMEFEKYSLIPSEAAKPLQLPFMRTLARRAANSELLDVFSSIIRYTSEPSLISPFVHKVAIRGLYELLSQPQPVELFEEFKPKFLAQRLRGLLQLQDTLPQDRVLYKRILGTGFDEDSHKGDTTSPEKKMRIKQDKKRKKTQKLKEMMLQKMKKQQNAFLSNAQVSEELKELISTPVETERSGTQSESSLSLTQQPSIDMSSTSSQKGEEQRCCVCHELLTLQDFKNQHPWGTPVYRGTSSIPKIAYAQALLQKSGETSDQEESKEKGGLLTDSIFAKINESVKETPYRHFHACPHYLHFKCFNDLYLTNMGSYFHFNSPIQKYACFENEWLCPLCRQLANTLLPPVFGSPQAITPILSEPAPAQQHTFKTDYKGLNVVKEFYSRALYDNPLPGFVEEMYSALFRVDLLAQIQYFFANERVALRAHLESILVMKDELKNKDNAYLTRMGSLAMKIAEYFNQGRDFAIDDKLGLIANLLQQMCNSGNIDATKLIEVWFTKSAENLVLLNYERREEELQDCQEYISLAICEVICVLSIFAPQVIPESNIQQMASPLFSLQPSALMDYLSDILHTSSLQIEKDFALKYESALQKFKSTDKPHDLYDHVKFKQALLSMQIHPELSMMTHLPEVLQSFQLKFMKQGCSFCHKVNTSRAYCLLCRKVFCMGSSIKSCEGCVGQSVGPLTLHANQCNRGKGAFITLSKADMLIFDGKKVAPLRPFYLDEFGNSLVELDKFPEHQADIRLREERVAQIVRLLAVDKGALETASVIVKAKTVFRRGVL